MNFSLIITGIILIFELIRDAFKKGDFIGYVNAGNAIINGTNVYLDPLNTWPPFFSIFSTILAYGDQLSPYGVRFIWLTGIIISLYYICKLSIQFTTSLKLNLFNKNKLKIQEPLVVIPILIMLRYIMDNMANVQINVYLLLCSILMLKYYLEDKLKWVGFFLGLIISLKVYPIVFLLFFIYKRELKTVAWTFLFIAIFNAIPFIIFGIETALENYSFWIEKVAKGSVFSTHRNQSLYAFLTRLLSTEPSGSITISIAELSAESVKKINYLIIAIISIIPAFIFRKKINNKLSMKPILEFAFIFAAIPVISPLAWKAYFIFLWLPYLIIYLVLFRLEYNISSRKLSFLKGVFYVSLVLTVFSTEAFAGGYFSDVLETLGAITFGTILIIILLTSFYIDYKKINFDSLVLQEEPGQ
jgi:hypothetical protein